MVMTLDVVNGENKKVGSVDLNDEVFAGPVKRDLIWESSRRTRDKSVRSRRPETAEGCQDLS